MTMFRPTTHSKRESECVKNLRDECQISTQTNMGWLRFYSEYLSNNLAGGPLLLPLNQVWNIFRLSWAPLIRGILILTFFRNHYFACSQVLPLASRFSKLFLFSLCDLSFPCRYFFSASMGISMGKWPKKLKWPKITFPGSKMVPKVCKWGI